MKTKVIFTPDTRELEIGQWFMYGEYCTLLTIDLVKSAPNTFKVVESKYPKYIKSNGILKSIPKDVIYMTDEYGRISFSNFMYTTSHFDVCTELEYQQQELAREAKKRYPIGTIYIDIETGGTHRIETGSFRTDAGEGSQFSESGKGYLNKCGVWAKIIKPMLTTTDGVDIYEGDTFWGVSKNTYVMNNYSADIDTIHNFTSRSICFVYFKSEEIALKWIYDNKPKTLRTYENRLKYSDANLYGHNPYVWLKNSEPRLYWTKILKMVRDDLNKESFKEDHGWAIEKDGLGVCEITDPMVNDILFNTEESAIHAIEIIGINNLKNIF